VYIFILSDNRIVFMWLEEAIKEQLKTAVVQSSFHALFERFCDEIGVVERLDESHWNRLCEAVDNKLVALDFTFDSDICKLDYMECDRTEDNNVIYVNEILLWQFFKNIGG
jgi:hypothetical protein